MGKKLLLKNALSKSKQEREWKFSLAKCRTEWIKCKERYTCLSSPFHIYAKPIAAFNGQKPLYLIGFKRSLLLDKISALVYYPNVGYVSIHSYSQKIWNKIVKEAGSSILVNGVLITIGEKGFELTETE